MQQNNVDTCLRCEASLSGSLSGSLWPSLALSGSLSGSPWLSLARCPAHSGSLWLSLALSGPLWLSLDLSGLLSGSLWLPLALSCSLRLSIALRICLQSPRLAHKALAQLAAALLRCMTLCWFGEDLPKKRMFTFRHCPNQGGGGPRPILLALFFTK